MRCARSWQGNVTVGADHNRPPNHLRQGYGGPPKPLAKAEGGHSVLFVAAACVVATVAFWAYTRTLLPGVDLGDTGGFQAAVLWPEQSARRAYPLYYALATPFIRAVSEDNPARGLNLFSAVWA